MNALLSQLSLPLLTKELTEQSSRGRTFILRTVYAVALYSVALGAFVNQSGGWDNLSFNILGTGGRLFTTVVQYQLAAIYLLLPMITAGTITSEKERDTLGILLITKLGPWTIVLEKFLSRVVPMLLYILMSLPLLAVAYSLGGVENGQVLQAGVVLVLCVLQVGSLAVLCSAWFRTTPQAVVCTYLMIAVLPMIGFFVTPIVPGVGEILLPALAPMQFASVRRIEGLERLASFAAAASLPVLAYLTIARFALWPRAFLTARSWGLVLLRSLDRFFHAINQNSVTRGVVIFRDHVPLPTARPLAWRELNKRSLGTTRYLIRFMLLTEAPLIAALLWPLATGAVFEDRNYATGEWALQAVWLLAVFMLLVQSTALITGERARQTLDVLMSTPMMTRDIVMQKMAGVHYLINILYVPMATAAIFWMFWLGAGQQRNPQTDAIWQFVRMIVQPMIYLPLVAWGGFYCGLYCKSQTQAMLLGIVILAVLVGVPQILFPMVFRPTSYPNVYGQSGNVYMPVTFMDSTWLWCLLRIPFPCSADVDAMWTRPGYGTTIISPMARVAELLHWALYGGVLYWLRSRAPQALTKSTQRAEAPIEDLALEAA